MIVGKFDPASFFQRVENIALHVAASELFGWLSRTLDLPPQWAALITRKTGEQQVVRPGGTLDGDDAEGVMFIRVSPFDIVIEDSGLASQDGFTCNAEVGLRLSVIPERSELASFLRAVLGSRRVAQHAAIQTLMQPVIGETLDRLIRQRSAADIVGARSGDEIAVEISEAVKAPCFSAGLTLERLPTVRISSTAFQGVREARERAAASRAEHEAAHEVEEALAVARDKHLEKLSDLLSRLKSLATATPEAPLPDLIRTFSESQRGEIYEALFAAETPASQTRWIVVAAGDDLLFFEPGRAESPSRRLRVSGLAGPMRSIQVHEDAGQGPVLLLGAATGVYRWPIDRAEPDATFVVPGSPGVRGGFNAAVIVGDRLFASHSELGLWEWDLSAPDNPRRLFESMTGAASAVRSVHAHSGDVYVAIDDRVICFHPDAAAEQPLHVYTGSTATITALRSTDDGLFAGNADGDVLHWLRGDNSEPRLLHRGVKRAVESVGLLASGGVSRLIFTDTTARVYAAVVGDSFKCEYRAGGQPLRRVEVAPDLLVATNDLRDRLFCWHPGKPNEPHATLPISRICSRSIQDVCLVPATHAPDVDS